VLQSDEHGAHRDALLLGAALALECAGEVAGPEEGVRRAAHALQDGSAARVLAAIARFGARVQGLRPA
jgi:anthranilate phosphoribosyltransferase